MPLLLCDLDDTVLDRAAAFRAWIDRFLARRGVDAAHREWLLEIDEAGNRPRESVFSLMRDRLDLPDPVETLVTDFYKEFASLFRCEAATRTALERARQRGWRIAIVTNGSASQEDKILATGVDELVDTWCISEVEGSRKPEVRLLHVAAERCGEPLDGAWMIGDNPEADIGAAHAAGIRSVWLRHGRPWPLAEYQPTHQAATFPEAVDLVLAASSIKA